MDDEAPRAIALDEARRGLAAREVPVGAIVVLDGMVIGRAHTAPITLTDPTAHAEVLALREAVASGRSSSPRTTTLSWPETTARVGARLSS